MLALLASLLALGPPPLTIQAWRSATSTRPGPPARASRCSTPIPERSADDLRQDLDVGHTPRVEIHYCPRCRWLMRAAWMAQELLTTFSEELGEVALVPSREAGLFRVILDDALIFDRREAGRFPEAKELKQLIRDRVAPDRELGHSDNRRES